MTTITSQTIPTHSSRGIGRLVAAFAVGAVLAATAATGITAAVDNGGTSRSTSTTPTVVRVIPSAAFDDCPGRLGRPC